MRILLWLSIGLDRRTPSEHLLSAIAKALKEKGHDVHILQKDTGGDKSALPEVLSQIGITTTCIKSVQSNRSNLIARYFEDIKYVIKCKRWIRRNRCFDRVFLQSSNIAGLQVFFLKNILGSIPIIFNVQDIFPENAVYSGVLSKKSIKYRLLSFIQKYAYQHVNSIITISEDMKEQLIEIGAPEYNIEVIYNWSYQDVPYDLSQIDYSKIVPMFDKKKFNVVYAGNIGRMQNVEIVLSTAELMRNQKDIAFHIFGDGVYREKLQDLAQQLSLDNVSFHSMLDSKDAPALYSYADINIVPLAKEIYRTALPSKTATCLACGKPIILAIGTKSIFGRIMKKNMDVQLIESDDLNTCCATILWLKENRSIRNNKDFYQDHFSITRNSSRYADIITLLSI